MVGISLISRMHVWSPCNRSNADHVTTCFVHLPGNVSFRKIEKGAPSFDRNHGFWNYAPVWWADCRVVSNATVSRRNWRIITSCNNDTLKEYSLRSHPVIQSIPIFFFNSYSEKSQQCHHFHWNWSMTGRHVATSSTNLRLSIKSKIMSLPSTIVYRVYIVYDHNLLYIYIYNCIWS